MEGLGGRLPAMTMGFGMDVGIGLPNTVPGTTGHDLLEWARRADSAGFSSLATIGAVSYPGYEELTVFAAAAAVTERVRLFSNVLIAPARSTAELAKQAATVDQISNGRLTLGLGVGWRDSDYVLTDRDFSQRGAGFDKLLRDLGKAWRGEALKEGTRPPAPQPVQAQIPLMIGGTSDAAISRAVKFGIGWTSGGLPPAMAGEFADKVRAAWADAGREGKPRIAALAYFSLGDTEDASRRALMDYYAPRGEETATMIANRALRSPDAITSALDGYANAGVDEVIFDATVSDPSQVDLLAAVVM